MKQQISLPILSTSGRPYSNTPLGRSTSHISSSASIRQEFLSNSFSNRISPSHLSLKKIKPEPWQRFFDGKKQQELTIKKNKQNVNELINEDFISLLNERNHSDENSQCSFLPAPIQTHIDHLYEQIDDLTLQLSEERIKHKQTKIKAEEILSNQLQNKEKQFQEILQEKLLDYKRELKQQEVNYFKLLNEEQTQNLQHEEQLRNEILFLKNSFHTYKINLDKQNIEILQMKIDEALATLKKDLPDKDEDINKKINDILSKERKTINSRHKIEIENIQKQYQKEIQLTQLELDQTKQQVNQLLTQIKDLENQHIETTKKLNNYRIHFDEKTKEIEKLHAERINQHI